MYGHILLVGVDNMLVYLPRPLAQGLIVSKRSLKLKPNLPIVWLTYKFFYFHPVMSSLHPCASPCNVERS